MGMKPGYKQTEAGVIPEDWDVMPLGNCVRLTSGESPSLIQFTDSGKPYFKVEQLSNCEKYLGNDSSPYHFLNGKTVPRNSVIFAKRGAAIALNRVRILSEDSFMDTNLMALTCLGELDHEFLYYGLGHIGLWQFADTTSVPQINNKHVKPLCFPIPATDEQHAIVAALSDVDALLGGLERLITKKRNLKQAAMQQLLTGQTRLPGFSGQWELGVLGNVVEALEAGVSVNSTDDDPSPGAPCVLKTSALSGGSFLPHEAKRIAFRDRFRARTNPRQDSILISRMNTPDLVGEIAYVGCDYPWLYLPDRVWMTRFRAGADLDARWLAYVLSSSTYKNLLKGVATGTSGSMKNISKDALLTLPIRFPGVEEQSAIAAILSDMDAELSALVARRDKTRALKQAMMQELLTGKTRLVSPEVAHA